MKKPWFSTNELLAPGDLSSSDFDATGVKVYSIQSSEHPYFDRAYAALWNEFGEKAEIEDRSIIERRLCWRGEMQACGYELNYQLLWIEKEGQPMGVRDHSFIVHHPMQRAIVHLSHNLIFPEWRRSGLAGWMRAFPLRFAYECLGTENQAFPVILVAEMEPYQEGLIDRFPRLASVEKAGFLKVKGFDYRQPDFRSIDIIDQEGGSRPLAMDLILRRVSKESDVEIEGSELHELILGLYEMYGEGFREIEMIGLKQSLQRIEMKKMYSLIKPTMI